MLGSLAKRTMEAVSSRAVPLYNGASLASSDTILFDGGTTGLSASRTEMGSLTTVYRAINFLCGVQAILPLEACRRSDKREVRVPVFESPSPLGAFTDVEWRFYEMQCRLLHGDSFHFKSGMTQQSPYPRYLSPIDPSRVEVYGVYRRGALIDRLYVVHRGITAIPPFGLDINQIMDEVGDSWDVYTGREIFHVPGQSFNGVRGLSPIDACAMSLAIEVATEKSSASFFGKGQMLSGFLRSDRRLDEETAERLKKRWRMKMAGVDNAYEVAVLDNGLTFQPLTVSPEQAQFLQMRQFNVEQVARIFGVPPFLLMSSNAGNSFGTGLEQQLTATDIFTLSYWLRTLEARASLELLPTTQKAYFDKMQLNRADVKSRWAAWAIARKNGILSVNEIRDSEGWSPVDDEEADDPLAPVPQGTAASEPGGNDGLQGGGSEADIGDANVEGDA